MKVIEPKVVIEDLDTSFRILNILERAGRTCYQSEPSGPAADFIRSKIMASGHESVIEHAKLTVRFITDRGVTHELVRHRLVSYSQESTRYCNYTKERFGGDVTFIRPCFWEEDSHGMAMWKRGMEFAECLYNDIILGGGKPEQARSVLPNSTKTEIVATANLREWRHIFKLRTSNRAHPQMRQVMVPLLAKVRELVPVIFDDLPTPDPAMRPAVVEVFHE
jgi:thymidylate synthase (FAD)